MEKGAFKDFAKLTRKHLCHSLSLIKLQTRAQIYKSTSFPVRVDD